MADRGNCKFFAPNYFNPTKCQNCFKPKEQHPSSPSADNSKTPLSKKLSNIRNAPPPKTLLKESVLLRGHPTKESKTPQTWDKHWFALFSNGELEEFPIQDGKVNKVKAVSTIRLQDYVRMLDGKDELNEDLCFGVKSLRDTVYFKTITRVDYENWWKEFSTFVAAPLKRAMSSATSLKSSISGSSVLSKPWFSKQYSTPSSIYSSKNSTRSSRSSSVSSTHNDLEDPQMDVLRTQVSKLEEENSRLNKTEEERRKLELEVNYWKEYVTNAQTLRKSGASVDTGKEIADSRKKIIQLQDELNENQKKVNQTSRKLLLQSKDLSDAKEKLHEANSIIAVHKAKIDQLTKELTLRDSSGLVFQPPPDIDINLLSEPKIPDGDVDQVSDSGSASSGSHHIEDKFLVLKDRLKRIEKELFLKSKELEKANESRSKVAKYTRTLLHELEARLSDTASKLTTTEEKLANTTMELEMERQRRKKLEDQTESPRRRSSSIIAPENIGGHFKIDTQSKPEFTEDDINSKYADYYRSRFKEVEASLMEKDRKLNEAEEKIKNMQEQFKNTSDNYKIIDELQAKLSDATHKLSDRQLKLHQLNREIESLKQIEKNYQRMTSENENAKRNSVNLERASSDQHRRIRQLEQDVELYKIREVVMKEQIQTYEEAEEDTDDEELDSDDQLRKSVETKNRIQQSIEHEAQNVKLRKDKTELEANVAQLEGRIAELEQSLQERSKTIKEEVPQPVVSPVESDLLANVEGLKNELSSQQEKSAKELSEVKAKFCEEVDLLRSELECERGRHKKLQDDYNTAVKEIDAAKSLSIDTKAELTAVLAKQAQTEDELSTKSSALQEFKTSLSRYEEENKDMKSQIETLEQTLNNRQSNDTVNSSVRQETLGAEKAPSEPSSPSSKTESESSDPSGNTVKRQVSLPLDEKSLPDRESIVGNRERDSGIEFQMNNSSVEIESANTAIVDSEYKLKYEELCLKFMASEQKVIELATELEGHVSKEGKSEENSSLNEIHGTLQSLAALEKRFHEIQSKLREAEKPLQQKADELEKERNNVINLVEVTSAYIKELENSLVEAKSKIEELQNVVELTKTQQDRPPPEGSSSGKDEVDVAVASNTVQRMDSLVDSSDGSEESAKSVRTKLSAKIMILQSDISELKASHANEIRQLQQEQQQQLEKMKMHGGGGQGSGDMAARVEELEQQLEQERESYTNEVEMLREQFQQELRQAFGGESSGMDLLNRVQELELEMEQQRKEHALKLKEVKEEFDREKEEMKDDMATVLQASLSASLASSSTSEPDQSENQQIQELEEKIISLQHEISDLKEQHQEEMDMEKDAHQREMEDTIRDMLMVRETAARYPDSTDDEQEPLRRSDTMSSTGSTGKKFCSSEEVEDLQKEFEQRLAERDEEHFAELEQARQDMAIVIASLKAGNTSETILELTTRIKDLESEIEELKAEHQVQMEDVSLKLKRAEAANFFGLRRNEEMGTKIYQMQNDLEEMDRKHKLEIDAYKERMSGDSHDDKHLNELIEANQQLEDKKEELEGELEKIRKVHIDEMELYSIKLQEEKRAIVDEMTDKVLKLESLIDDMKKDHQANIENYEKRVKEENQDAVSQEREQIRVLERKLESVKREYEVEVDELSSEHRKEVAKLRQFYEKEREKEPKRRTMSEADNAKLKSEQELKKKHASELKEEREKHDEEVKEIRSRYEAEMRVLKSSFEVEMEDLKTSFEREKLKLKEQLEETPLTRSSASVARSDSPVSTVSRAEAAERARELKKKHEEEVKQIYASFDVERQKWEDDLNNQINDIRSQYDMRLKDSMKEGMRRQSMSERKSDGTRMRELVSTNENLRTKLLETELKYEDEVKNFKITIRRLEKTISELKAGDSTDGAKSTADDSEESKSVPVSLESLEKEEAAKKLKELKDQIERYGRRIEYYQDKAEEGRTDTQPRIQELQSEIVKLQQEVRVLEGDKKQDVWETEKNEKSSSAKAAAAASRVHPRRYTDSFDGVDKPKSSVLHRKRWSTLEERSEKDDVNKGGSVRARKALWENKTTAAPSSRTSVTTTTASRKFSTGVS